MRTRQASIGRALSWSAMSSAVILLMNVATGVLLARALGPELRGSLAAAMVWPALLGGIGVFGLMEAVSYYAARAETPDGELIGSALVAAGFVSAVVVAIATLVITIALSNQTEATERAAYMYLGYIPINIVTLVLGGYVNGRQRLRWFQALRVFVISAGAAGLYCAAAMGLLNVTNAITVYLTAGVATTLVATVMVARLVDERLRVTRTTLGGLLAFGRRSFVSTAAWRSNERIDQPVIAALLPPVQLGLYVTAVTLSSVASLVGTSVVYVGLPSMAALTSVDERRRLARRLVRMTLLTSAGLSLAIFAVAPELMALLFGEQFVVAAPVARILLVASVLLAVNRAIESILTGIGRPWDAARAELLALPVTAVGLAVLLPTLGIAGAGWASLAAYMVSFVAMSGRAARALDTSWQTLLVPDRTDAIALMRRVRRRR